MPSSLASAGATVEPSEYAALAQDEQFTGMWTQRSPLRDADVPWVYRKFYGASRFDSILDGINREISARLTDVRRPGSSVYNSVIFPRINRFYPFRRFDAGQESIHVMADCDGSANQLQNPDFQAGATGWTLGTGWSVGMGGTPSGIKNVGIFSDTAGAITNQQQIPCTAGTLIDANCLGLGELGATGTAVLEVNFYDGSNTLISTVQSSPVLNNYIWTSMDVSATAPGGSAYATVDFSVTGSSVGPRWFCSGFTGSYFPAAGTVRDVTGPSTNTILWEKDPAAGKTSFASVGNVLYAGDGHDTHQWVTSSQAWMANTQYQPGEFIIDSNNNIQMAVGSVTANVVNLQIDDVLLGGSSHGRKVTLWFDPSTPFDVPNNISVTTSGVATVPPGTTIPDGASPYTVVVESVLQLYWIHALPSPPITAYSGATGTVTTGSGATGGTVPTWNTTLGLVTQDGGLQWVNMGSAVMAFGSAGPAAAPTVSFTQAPSIYPNWAANTWYAPFDFVIRDGNGNLEAVVTGGTTHPSTGEPSWAPVGGNTTDGSVIWKNLGAGAWVASNAYALGDVVQATFSYYTTTFQWTSDGHGGFIQEAVPTLITATGVFQCIVAGTSGANQPSWNNGIGVITQEPSGLTWKNTGIGPAYPGSSQTIVLTNKVIDPNGYLQTVTVHGKSGSTAPTFATTTGATTVDNSTVWINSGAFTAAGTGAWQWAYSGKNSITGEISNPSPISIPFVPALNQTPVIQGQGLAQPPWDTIVLWRTAAAGTTLLWDDEFPNPGTTSTWIYTDTNPDSRLNTALPAPGATGGATLTTPPPATAVAPEFHCGRIWMINGSYVIYSGGPDTVTGNGYTSFPPLNYFQFPEQPIKLKSVTLQTGGLIVFCVSNTYIILGDGTGSPPFQTPRMYMEGIGIKSYDALCMVGSTFYGMSHKIKAFSIDPGGGYLEIGFPVGDQFARVTTGGINAALYDPQTAYVTWHEKDSTDTGLYVSDSQVGWFRWSAIAPPESGSLWSPRAAIVDGTSAVQSVEVSPGNFELLIGPSTAGPILKRDPAVYGDWDQGTGAYQGYPAWDVKGAIGLCETGEVAEVAHIALKSAAVGARPEVSLLLDEIKAGVTVEGRTTAWDTLSLDDGRHEDPPNLEPSISMFSDRYQCSSTAECPKCETFLLKIDYGAQQEPDELLKFAVYGAVFKEKRQQ